MTRKLIPAKIARELCGGKSNMTLHRWLNDASMGFPRPVYINGRRYFVEAEIASFIEAQAAKRSYPAASANDVITKSAA